jgi:hypothetical protein
MTRFPRLRKLEDCAHLALLAGAVVLLTVEAICTSIYGLGLEFLTKVEGK